MIGVRVEPQQATNTEILVITSKRVGGNVGVRLRLTPTYAVRGTRLELNGLFWTDDNKLKEGLQLQGFTRFFEY